MAAVFGENHNNSNYYFPVNWFAILQGRRSCISYSQQHAVGRGVLVAMGIEVWV